MRKNLKLFRVEKNMTQEDIANEIGCTRATYQSVEAGARIGTDAGFWIKLQKAFNIPDGDMWALRKNEK